ncbi:spore germination protein [Bacillus sp. sid0103]|uniref:GerAB/ArcD/ProY family transporter n=1 Tax=Bacillus sp. sid0103 TaxID=2856337 RepID=UPI001C473D9B|nr:endospore germination permease [Bacillus sp. sid0103]MBV7507626.1 spore germination protein [Bacillus sp. sid0103]
MIEKGKISAVQMAIIMNPTILATALLLVPAVTARHAKQDLWISPIWASIIGLIVVYVAFHLNRLYPKETIIEYSGHILGKIPGKVLGFFYLFFYLHINGIIIREYGEFVIGTFLMQTPMIIVISAMILVSAFAVYGGIEVIARAAQIIVPVVIILYLLISFMLMKDLEVKNILPIMEHGMKPSFMGSIVPQSWFSEFLLITFMLPYLKDRQKGFKWGFISICSILFILVLANISTYMLFGGLTGTFTYPVMVAVRYISIADFLEHLEAIVMAIWVTGVFVKITIFFYALALGTAQWLNLSDYRPIILPIGLLLVIFGLWTAPNLPELEHFLSTSAPFYFLTLQLGIPCVLLLIAMLRKKVQQNKGEIK